MTDAVSVLVYSTVIGVYSVFLYVLVFAYVDGCGSYGDPNLCQILFLIHVRCYEKLKEVKSKTSLVFFLPTVMRHDMRVPN